MGGGTGVREEGNASNVDCMEDMEKSCTGKTISKVGCFI